MDATSPIERPCSALPGLDPRTLLAPRRDDPPSFPFRSSGTVRLTYLARAALYHGLRALGVGPGDVVLMPAYHHGVEVAAVRATGAQVRYFRVDAALRVDLDDLRARLSAEPRARVIYLIHYAGLPGPAAEAAALARERGLLFVEDCALALLSRDDEGVPLGARADLSAFCLYKALPVPHGGLAVLREPVALPALAPPPLASVANLLARRLLVHLERRHGPGVARLRLRARAAVAPFAAAARYERVDVDTNELGPRDLLLGASPVVPALLARIDLRAVAARRRRNYERLYDRLPDARLAAQGRLPQNACPLFFSLRVADRDAALRRLRSRGIQAIDLWRTGTPEARGLFPEVEALRRHVIEVPIHQDLDDEDVDRVAAALRGLAPP